MSEGRIGKPGETLSDVVQRHRGYNDAARGAPRPKHACAAYFEGYDAGAQIREMCGTLKA